MSKQGFEYWFQWQVPVCGAILVIPAVVALKHIKTQKSHEPVRSFHLWNSCWRTLSPLWLLLYRAFAFISLALILFNMVSLMGAFAFYFYTQWTFALVMAYFGLASVMSAHGCWVSMKKKRESPEEEFKEEIQCGADCWGHLMLAMYQICAGACVLTDLVFWCLLVPLHVNVQFQLTFLIVCLHTANVVFLIGDTALNRLPFTWFGFANFVLWSCIYMGFQWVVHACGFTTWWPYPFLELNTPWAPLCYLGMALFHVPCYGIYALIFRAKNSLFPRLFPRAYVRTLN